MNESNEVYWEKKKQPEYPMFQELKETKPSWDNVKQVFDVEDKYQRFYGGILGNEVADKEQKRTTRGTPKAKEEQEDEDEYFNSLRTKIKTGKDDSPQNESNCPCDKEKGIVCQVCSVKKGNSASNSPRTRRSNSDLGTIISTSSSNSPRNTITMGNGNLPSKFKKS